MRYSEAKKIIELLQIAGWYKITGFPFYRKVWRNGELMYARQIIWDEVVNTRTPINYILGHYDKLAYKEFDRYMTASR